MADFISREAAIKAIQDYGKGAISDGMTALDPVDDIVSLAMAMEWLDAADAAPMVHGWWLDGRCTVCGWEEPDEIGYDGYELSSWEHTNYCPGCGAKMDGGDGNETD